MAAHARWIAAAPDLLRFMTHVDLDSTVPDVLEAARSVEEWPDSDR